MGLAAGLAATQPVREEWPCFGVVEVDQDLVEHAARPALDDELRSLDALHLTAALLLRPAQGLGVIAVPFSFISSAFVPPSSMPTVLRAIADYQPMTFVINSARGLMLGPDITHTYGHSLAYYVIGSLAWCAVLTAIIVPLLVRAYRRS